MNVVASMIVRDELGRYLAPVVDHLLAFCDEVRVLDDGSSDGSRELLESLDRVAVRSNTGPRCFQHEGRARQALLDWTLAGSPSHVLAVDADEVVADGPLVREACADLSGVPLFALTVEEVWRAEPDSLFTREDGGWRRHPLPCVWRVSGPANAYRMVQRQLACGRLPIRAMVARAQVVELPTSLLHWGWANREGRPLRAARYARVDRGRFHARQHLDSILWPDARVVLEERSWPLGLGAWRAELLERASLPAAA